MKRLLIESLTSVFIRVLGSLSAFGLTYVIAKQFSSIDAGYFFFFLSMLFISSSICRFGLDNVFLKLIGEKSILLKEDYITLKSGFLLTIINSIFFIILTYIFYQLQILPWFIFTGLCVSLPVFNFVFLFGMISQGQSKTIISVLILNILINFITCMFLYFLNFTELHNLVFFYICSIFFVLLLCFCSNLNVTKRIIISKTDFASVIKKSFPFFIFTFNGQMQIWFGQFCLGMFTLSSAVANFAISLRVSLLLSFILVAINIVIAPKIAYCVRHNEHSNLKKLIMNSNIIIYVISLPVFIIFFLNVELIIDLFGAEYSEDLSIIYILLLGQLVNVLTGSVGYLLSMGGHERDLKYISLFSLSILILFSFILIPIYSEVGAAIATCTSIILQNTISAFYVKKRLGINIFAILGRSA